MNGPNIAQSPNYEGPPGPLNKLNILIIIIIIKRIIAQHYLLKTKILQEFIY